MKLGILTHALHNNYGGILQAYALRTILQKKGHDVEVIRRDYTYRKDTIFWNFARFIKNVIRICTGHKKYKYISQKQWNIVSENTQYFIKKYINYNTSLIVTNLALKAYATKSGFDGYVVGSDQVWRPKYVPCITNYFLDFAENKKVKRVAYAASFGVDEWLFSKKITPTLSSLIKKFDAVSVREKSGVDLCNRYLGVDALHVLDPTMLLEKEDYIDLIIAENEEVLEGNLFCYILDNTKKKDDVIDLIVQSTNLVSFTCMPKLNLSLENVEQDIDACVFPSVTRWLKSFMDANMIITDSFHGCVFSIIFNKPFWVIGNKSRGMARFDSLLSVFGLENRMLDINNIVDIDWSLPIEWDRVNKIKKEWQIKSNKFLLEALK